MDDIKDMFDRAAETWDTPTRVSRARAVAKEIESVCQLTGEHKIEKALEFGCGTGLVGLFLQPYIQKLYLTDNSEGMIGVLRDKLRILGFDRVQEGLEKAVSSVEAVCVDFLETSEDALSLSTLADQDLIFSSMALHHIRPIDQLLGTFKDLLKTQGTLCLVDLNQDDEGAFHRHEKEFLGHHGFLQEEMAERMALQGFSNIKHHTFFEDVKEKAGEKVPYSLFIMWGTKE